MEKKWMGIIALAIISGMASGIGSSIFQNQLQNDEMQELKNLVSVLNTTAIENQEQTSIMNRELETIEKSLEKKSKISVLIQYHGEDTSFGSYGGTVGGGEYTRDVKSVRGSIKLIENQTALFDIILTNVGTDTARIDWFDVSIIYVHDFGSSQSWHYQQPIDHILKPNSDPYTVQYALDVEDIPTEGDIYFTIHHNDGYIESTIPFRVVDS